MEQGAEQKCSVCGLLPKFEQRSASIHIIARAPSTRAVLKTTSKFARSNAPVTIFGETGTGKEIIARSIHQNSRRSSEPFVVINVAALPSELLESELFGHGKGAFTGATNTRRGLFEEANKGTLFLDEIGEMPLPLQAKLLRVLQDGEIRRVGENKPFGVDVRIVCATHRNLRNRITDGTFREDLYYRLNVLSLEVPPLRRRREDILPLARHFLVREDCEASGFNQAATDALCGYDWPGNIRELHNVVRRGVALAEGSEITLEDLPAELQQNQPSKARPAPRSGLSGLSLAEVERLHVLETLDDCGGSQTKAAQMLGISRNTLWRKLRRYAADDQSAP